MIKPLIFNGVNFSDDFNRESRFFNPKLQRVKNIISPISGGYLGFEYTPSVMPETTPAATMYFIKEDGSVSYSQPSSHTTELTDRFIFFCHMNVVPVDVDSMYFKVDDTTEIIHSEKVRFVAAADLAENSIVKIIAYNNDDRFGYCSTYPAFGFFEVSELDRDKIGKDLTTYQYSYGRSKVLKPEIWFKKSLLFHNLSMFQKNALDILCSLQNKTINGVSVSLASEFTEENKDPLNEICNMRAEFVTTAQSFTIIGSTGVASQITPTDLFM